MASGLDDLFRFLDRQETRPDLNDLIAYLLHLDLSGGGFEEFIHFSDGHYQRNLVKAAPDYHVWVMCWKVGQGSPIHDHGGSACPVRADSGDIKATHSEDVSVGGVIGTQDGDLHQVSNLQSAGRELVTLHVYSPPLLRMGTYSILDATRSIDVWPECIEGAGI